SRYNTGVELGNVLVGSDLLNHSWDAISKLQKDTLLVDQNQSLPFSAKYQVYDYPPTKGSIIAFVCSPNCAVNHLQEEEFRELVSSDAITSFDFLCTKSNSSVSLHKAAFTLFASLENELSLLKHQVHCLKLL
ncbi:hypothetical protein A4A49_42424, partial [Nicotiana attenuata]